MNPRWRARAGNGFLLVLCVLLVGRTTLRVEPLWNWDVLGYMALALEWSEDDPEIVHRETYAAAERELPPPVYRSLVDPRVEVRRERSADAAAFTEHIAFYRARVLTTLAVAALHGLGAPLSYAVWWLSLACFVALAALIVCWLGARIPLAAALVAGTLLAHSPPLLVTAKLATADGLGALLVSLGAYLLVERRATRAGAAVLSAAILARPDSVILIGLLALALAWFEHSETGAGRIGVRFASIWIAVSAVLYLAVQAFAGEYGWWPLFQISFLGKAVHPSELASSVDWGVYSAVLGHQADELVTRGGYLGTPNLVTGSTFALAYAGFAVLVLALVGSRWRREAYRRHVLLLTVLLAAYTLRWFLFPQLWDRFLAPLYVLVPLIAVSLARAAQNDAKDVTPAITSS